MPKALVRADLDAMQCSAPGCARCKKTIAVVAVAAGALP
jgi:hypothetical protein